VGPGVLDSSALLAVIQSEPGSDIVIPLLLDSIISVVNAAEVQAKLVRCGEDPDIAWELATDGIGQIVPFDAVQAKLCGSLITRTKVAGLSAGDRACLALAITLGLPVYTADRAWSRVNVGCDIRLIR
jgi:ribonuclease VapC